MESLIGMVFGIVFFVWVAVKMSKVCKDANDVYDGVTNWARKNKDR